MKPRKVLVVDNNLEFMNLFKQQSAELLSPACQVITAKSGQEAVRALQQQQIDVLFTGDILTDMTGFELAQTAATLSPSTQMYLVSAMDQARLDQKARRLHLNLDGYLNKTALYLELLESESRKTDENSYWAIFEE